MGQGQFGCWGFGFRRAVTLDSGKTGLAGKLEPGFVVLGSVLFWWSVWVGFAVFDFRSMVFGCE